MAKKKSFLKKIQTWSQGMDDLFEYEIHRPVVNDSRTTFVGNMNPLGYPFNLIQPNVLQMGRGNFSKGYYDKRYGRLTREDTVLLYCFLNLRGHFHSSRASFRLSKKLLITTFLEHRPILIDIGCGPATSALALADLFPDTKFAYVGIDSASQMRDRGERFLQVARRKGVMNKKIPSMFRPSWEKLLSSYPDDCAIMFNFAFFFASKTLQVKHIKSLAKKVNRIGTKLKRGSVIISYTNAEEPDASENYDRFLDYLEGKPKSKRKKLKVLYRNRRGQLGDPKSQEFVRELFELVF